MTATNTCSNFGSKWCSPPKYCYPLHSETEIPLMRYEYFYANYGTQNFVTSEFCDLTNF